MKHWAAFALALTLVSTGNMARAATPAHAQVEVKHAWIRVLPGSLPAGGYADIRNSGDKVLALVGADSPDYQHVMLHQSTTENGMSRMHMVKQLPLPAHATTRLAPGGYHLMLMQATHTIKPGDKVPVTLHFADGSTLQADFIARPANATGPGPN